VIQAGKKGVLAAEAWVEILVCRARLRLPRLLGAECFLRRELAEEPHERSASQPLASLVDAFRIAHRVQPGAGCLPRSLALRRFLTRHGQRSHLELGLRKAESRLRGHAWVEAGGTVVSGDALFVRSFVQLVTPRTVRRADG
jgi:hypothetical protein